MAFTPTHPFIYLTPSDITTMQDNVLTQQYPWAVALYNDAKTSAKTGTWDYTTYGTAKDMLGCALVYLIDGDTSYADGAVYWLLEYEANYDPQDQTMVGDYPLEKHYHFKPFQVIIPIVYDLMYNYMSANRPTDLTTLTTYMEWLDDRMQGSFGHNENHQNHYGSAMCAMVVGNDTQMTTVETDFKEWYDGTTNKVHDGFHYEAGSSGLGSQAMKHFAYVIESQAHYILAVKRCFDAGHTTWDPTTWTSAQGYNLIDRNWRTIIKKSTPDMQVPFEPLWRGNLYKWSTCSGLCHIAYLLTGDEDWQAVVANNTDYDVIPHDTVDTDWAGLAFGREITGTPQILNDCFKNDDIGKVVMLSGDPTARTDPATSNHVYFVAGTYGTYTNMNVIYYGGGNILNACPMAPDSVDGAFGEDGRGGSYVNPYPSETDGFATSLTMHTWDVTSSDVKATVWTNDYHKRAIFVTDDYFVDVYDVTDAGGTMVTWDFHGIGDTASVSQTGSSISTDYTAQWDGHSKMHVFNDYATEVNMGTGEDTAWEIADVNHRQVNPVHETETIRKLRGRRRNVDVPGKTRYVSVLEPLGNGSTLTSVERWDDVSYETVTSLKIETATYTDYLLYNDGETEQTVTVEGESITINGRWGMVRNVSGVSTSYGDVTTHNIGTPVSVYYIDPDSGDDTNDGESEGAAWAHAPGDANATSNAASATLNAGDSVLFKKSTIYKGSISLDWSGTSSNRITYDGGSWGTGDNCLLDGQNTDLSGYTDAGGAQSYLTIKRLGFTKFGGHKDDDPIWTGNLFSVDTGSNVITTGAAHGLSINDPVLFTSSAADLPSPLIHPTDETLYYVLTTPTTTTLTISDSEGGAEIDLTTTGSGTLELWEPLNTGAAGYGVNLEGGSSYVTIEDCQMSEIGQWRNTAPCRGTGSVSGNGVALEDNSNISVLDCDFTRMKTGVSIKADVQTDNVEVNGCLFHNHMNWLIDIAPRSSGAVFDKITIDGCDFFDYTEFDRPNWEGFADKPHQDGIFLRTANTPSTWTDIVIKNSRWWSDDTSDGGTASIYISQGPSVTIYNCSFLNENHLNGAILISYAPAAGMTQSVRIWNCTSGESGRLFKLSDNADADAIDYRNNLAWRDGTLDTMSADIASTASLTSDYNLFYNNNSDAVIYDGSYISLAEWQTNSSGDANSVNAAPILTDTSGDASTWDISPLAGSPALGTGTDLSSVGGSLIPEMNDVTSWNMGIITNSSPPSGGDNNPKRYSQSSSIIFML